MEGLEPLGPFVKGSTRVSGKGYPGQQLLSGCRAKSRIGRGRLYPTGGPPGARRCMDNLAALERRRACRAITHSAKRLRAYVNCGRRRRRPQPMSLVRPQRQRLIGSSHVPLCAGRISCRAPRRPTSAPVSCQRFARQATPRISSRGTQVHAWCRARARARQSFMTERRSSSRGTT
jgi:hypothetical protein